MWEKMSTRRRRGRVGDHWTDYLKGWHIFAIWMAIVVVAPIAFIIIGKELSLDQALALIFIGVCIIAFMAFFGSMSSNWNKTAVEENREFWARLDSRTTNCDDKTDD
ncbi:hypothetical protein AAH991_31365 [Microbispora sp. ZYX-F-249]|uniref:Uncharacterized protein n=1 Tax=Microbispora maris TaxID=3144104 RepID=A0ABV0AY61_9ACTN